MLCVGFLPGCGSLLLLLLLLLSTAAAADVAVVSWLALDVEATGEVAQGKDIAQASGVR